MLRKLMIQSVLGSLLIAAAPAAHAACPAGFYSLGLKTSDSLAPDGGLAGVSFTPGGAPTAVGTAACPNWRMAALQIRIPAGCTQANILIEYEGLPRDWTVNLGDSPTNDGFAGDAGSPDSEAELWVLNEDLGLAPANKLAPALGIDNPLVRDSLALTDGALKLVVKNQSVTWGQPASLVQMPATNNLFAIPDKAPVPVARRRSVFLGLNRVISGPGNRIGCGARRVLITYQ